MYVSPHTHLRVSVASCFCFSCFCRKGLQNSHFYIWNLSSQYKTISSSFIGNESDVGDLFPKHIWYPVGGNTHTHLLYMFDSLVYKISVNLSTVVEGYGAVICPGGPGLIWQGIYAPPWWQYVFSAWHTETNGNVWSGSPSWKAVILSSAHSRKLPPVPAATLKEHSTDYLPTLSHEKNHCGNPVDVLYFFFLPSVFPAIALPTDRGGKSSSA